MRKSHPMILKKQFYFVRHGETDQNKYLTYDKNIDSPLNATGRMQALSIAPIIETLPFQTICCSPLKRAKETKELLLPNMAHQEIMDLCECTIDVFTEMTSLGEKAYHKGSSSVRDFLEQAKNGINQALKYKGPVLIVAHGGIHWAMCYWMNIQNHDWMIDHCKPVHFLINENHNEWNSSWIN